MKTLCQSRIPHQADHAHIGWWFRESTQEWVLEIDIVADDRSLTVRYTGPTKRAALAQLESTLGS